jgi:hypothetical protein
VIPACTHHCIHSPAPPIALPWHPNIKAERSEISIEFATKATYIPNLQTMLLELNLQP